jgi:hypothetical protein
LLEATMSKSPSPELLHLHDGEFLSAGTVWLSVVRGRVWITQADDPVDHFLDGGQAIRLRAGAHALVGAEGEATVMLARAPTWRDRLRQSLAWRKSDRSTPAPNAAAPRPSGWASARAAVPGTR